VEYVRFDRVKKIEIEESTSLKDLVAIANQENEVVLTQDNKPVAKVLPIASSQEYSNGISGRRTLGLHRGAWKVGSDFDGPLPDEFWLGEK
jgi:prevent-host-death family protein